MSKWSAWISLFASTGTLFCCALPSFLVVLGMGATMAGLVSSVPQLIWLSQYKLLVFSLSGLMILISFYLEKRSEKLACPIDPQLAAACAETRVWSKWILYFSAGLWALGAFFAFVIQYL